MSGVLLKGRQVVIVEKALQVFMDILYDSKSPDEAAEKARRYWEKLHVSRDIYSRVGDGGE